MKRFVWSVIWWPCLACGLATPTVGTTVAPGVATATFEIRAAHTDLVRVPMFYPSDDSGHAVGTSLPAIVYVQGGAVSTDRYDWLATELARSGFVIALPEHPLQLAFFSIDRARATADFLRQVRTGSVLEGVVDGNRLGVAGHSLGGVVAGKAAISANLQALAFNASYPDTADSQAIAAFNRPALSLAGELDCSAKLEQVSQGFDRLSSPAALVVLSGVTHYQFTDSQREDDQRGCTPGLSLDEAHRRIAQAMTAFFRAAMPADDTGSPSVGSTELMQVPGGTVTLK